MQHFILQQYIKKAQTSINLSRQLSQNHQYKINKITILHNKQFVITFYQSFGIFENETEQH